LLALRTSPPSFGIAEGERVARDLYGLAVEVSALPGERDSNFRLRTADAPDAQAPDAGTREFVLKIQDVANDGDSNDCLVAVLDHLAEQDPTLPVPRLFPTLKGESIGHFTRDGVDYATCLVSFLPGQLLAESRPDTALLQNVGTTLARIDRALRGFFHPSLTRRLAWDVRRLPELVEFSAHIESAPLRAAVEAVAGTFRRCLPRLRALRSQAIHGDCHASNLLVDIHGRSVCGILDFGDMIHAPLIVEPAIAMSELLTEAVAPLDSAAAVLHGYAQGQRLETDDVELLYDLLTARHAVTVLVHAWRRIHDPRGAAALDGTSNQAAGSLHHLLSLDRRGLTDTWHVAAGTFSPAGALAVSMPAASVAGPTASAAAAAAAARGGAAGAGSAHLARRHRLMGAGAELFYQNPLHLVRGAGVWLYDSQGRAYLDVYNNVPHVGHTHPAVVAAIQRQTAILATHTRYLHDGILDYAERLTSRMPAHLDACIFVNSGSEANDVAWRMAQMATGHRGGLVMETAYHGITDAVAALTPGVGRPHDPRVVTLAPPPDGLKNGDAWQPAQSAEATRDADQAAARLAERGFAPAAFYIDTAITSSGIFDPPAGWAQAVERRVRAAGALIVADEVQYGLGRSGSHFWGFERRGLRPDIVTLGKPVANGYPMGVVVANRGLIEAFQAKHGFFSTFGGSAVAAAAALAVLEVLDREELMANAAVTGAYLRSQLEAVAARHACLGQVRGTGLLLGLDVLADDGSPSRLRNKRIVNALASEFRILIGYEGPEASILKLRPPMPFRREHADLLVQAIDAAAAAVDAGGI
jgi:4-aminobutyrate aminotransferase-like enzyme/Ser/Thr protein kinase RdoA (MazF antagonist)